MQILRILPYIDITLDIYRNIYDAQFKKVARLRAVFCSICADALNEFLQDPDGWHTEDREKMLSAIRNTTSQAIWFIEFGEPWQNATELQDLLYHLFLEEDRDSEWLERHGVILDHINRKELDEMYTATDVIFDSGNSQGKTEILNKLASFLTPAEYQAFLKTLDTKESAPSRPEK